MWFPAVRAGSGADVFTMRLADALRLCGVSATITWFPHWSELAPDLLRAVRPPAGTDVIHANSAYAFSFRRNGVPLVATEHHYPLDPAYRPYKSMAQHLYHRALIGPYLHRSYACADAITTDSRFTADVLRRVAGVEASRTIPLWVDYDKFSPAPAAPGSDGRFRLLFVGNASRRKGADVIPLLGHRLGADFEIRCTSGLRADRRDGGGGNITLLGRLTEGQLINEYRTCDAVLVPSRYEGFGYTALEAMACGKPVVGFRCGAVDEVVAEGETGLLGGIDDLDALEKNCRRLASDIATARAFGQAGRGRATAIFTEDRAIDAYLAIYQSLLAGEATNVKTE
ncbi:MAG: glycosyltransferase family 4 protein [Rhodanobacteraceae bacterium]